MKFSDIELPINEYGHTSARCPNINDVDELAKHQLGEPIYSWNRIHRFLNIKDLDDLVWNVYSEGVQINSDEFQYHTVVGGKTADLALFMMEYNEGGISLADGQISDKWGFYRLNNKDKGAYYALMHIFKAGAL